MVKNVQCCQCHPCISLHHLYPPTNSRTPPLGATERTQPKKNLTAVGLWWDAPNWGTWAAGKYSSPSFHLLLSLGSKEKNMVCVKYWGVWVGNWAGIQKCSESCSESWDLIFILKRSQIFQAIPWNLNVILDVTLEVNPENDSFMFNFIVKITTIICAIWEIVKKKLV